MTSPAFTMIGGRRDPRGGRRRGRARARRPGRAAHRAVRRLRADLDRARDRGGRADPRRARWGTAPRRSTRGTRCSADVANAPLPALCRAPLFRQGPSPRRADISAVAAGLRAPNDLAVHRGRRPLAAAPLWRRPLPSTRGSSTMQGRTTGGTTPKALLRSDI
jgi:hypothetical protein